MRTISLFVALCSFWFILSGQTRPFLLMAGIVCCALTTYISCRMKIVDSEGFAIEHCLRFLLYVPWLVWQVVISNWDVAKLVWRPTIQVDPEMVEIPYSTKTGFGTATYANSITLTPGTVTVVVKDGKMLVHALTKEAAEGLLDPSMQNRVRRLEGSLS